MHIISLIPVLHKHRLSSCCRPGAAEGSCSSQGVCIIRRDWGYAASQGPVLIGIPGASWLHSNGVSCCSGLWLHSRKEVLDTFWHPGGSQTLHTEGLSVCPSSLWHSMGCKHTHDFRGKRPVSRSKYLQVSWPEHDDTRAFGVFTFREEVAPK